MNPRGTSLPEDNGASERGFDAPFSATVADNEQSALVLNAPVRLANNHSMGFQRVGL